MAIAAVSPVLPPWSEVNSTIGSVNTRPPPTKKVSKNSFHEIKNANSAPTSTPGAIIGSVTCHSTSMGEAPSVRAWAS